MNKIRFFQVDAFAEKQFKGNPAGVCVLYDDISEESMQSIAEENNLSETAFLVKVKDGFNLRWFTPSVEVDLCGHATLASAHILWQEGVIKSDETIRFYTRSGTLTAAKVGDWIELDFPASFEEDRALPPEALSALNVKPVNVVFSKTRYLVELSSEEEVVACRPDFNKLKDQEMIVITSKGGKSSKYDFVSRSFAPSHGIDEDPVTGSSHCCLTTYWSKRLGKTEMLAYQASTRGGEVKVKLAGDRVLFSGKAVTVVAGYFILND
ncbi:PhzF family phenazine biosynthesis protein [Pedobacter sp. P351]|uniref:PhzF family phenazine biosynthesis protein n=1 Tax=Pedobacter superstes TaxID=3133441 RepID=UPI0030B72CA7